MSNEGPTETENEPVEVHGFVKEGFEGVRELFRKTLEDGTEKGGSFAAYYKGELAVNIWGGEVEKELDWMWEEDTINLFFSTTKSISSIVIAHMVDRGLLAYEENISKYWPEFGQNGKENITLKTYMSNRAGLSALDEPYENTWALDDPDRLGNALAKQKPLWEPGTTFGYHPITFALYLDQIVRRVDPEKRSLAQYFKEEIAVPFDINFVIGLPLELYYKTARYKMLIEASQEEMMETMKGNEEIIQKMLSNPKPNKEATMSWNNPKLRQLPIGSVFGHGTAEAVAKIHGILANGGVHNGKRLLSEEAIKRQQVPLSRGTGFAFGLDALFSLGTMVIPYVDGDSEPKMMFGHGGYGGQMGMADATHKVGYAYATNHLNPFLIQQPKGDHRWWNMQEELFKCVYKIENISVERRAFVSNTEFQEYEESRK